MPSKRDDRASATDPAACRGAAAPIRLAERLVAALAHDIAGPLGMIEGLLEMVSDDENASPDALATAAQAATRLIARLKLRRAAWGGGPGGIGIPELRALASGLSGHGIRLDLSGLPGNGTFAPAPAHVLLNLLMLADDALAGQGVIALAGDPAREILLTIEGRRAAWPPGFAAMLADDAAAWESVTAVAGPPPQGALTALIARASGLRLSMLFATPGPANPPLLLVCVPET